MVLKFLKFYKLSVWECPEMDKVSRKLSIRSEILKHTRLHFLAHNFCSEK